MDRQTVNKVVLSSISAQLNEHRFLLQSAALSSITQQRRYLKILVLDCKSQKVVNDSTYYENGYQIDAKLRTATNILKRKTSDHRLDIYLYLS